MYDGRIGRWLSTDPKGQFASPYEGMGDNPVMGTDPTGGYDTWAGAVLASLFCFSCEVYKDESGGINNGQWFYSKAPTVSTGSDGTVTVTAGIPQYGAGSKMSQTVNNVTNNLIRQNYESHLKVGDYNKYTRQIQGRDEGAVTNVYPVENVIFAVATLGGSTEAEGGMAAVRAAGQAGEDAVGIAGPKTYIEVAGRTRIPDRLTATTIEEVKNVAHQSFAGQLRDFYQYAQDNGLDMILHTRSNTTFSGPLQQMINNGSIIQKTIPGL